MAVFNRSNSEFYNFFFLVGCYGVQDTASLSSTISSCSTEPWFCEACKAGVENPTCELCPNTGNSYLCIAVYFIYIYFNLDYFKYLLRKYWHI